MMPSPDQHLKRFNDRNERAMKAIAGLLETRDIDNRLTAGELHAAACEALGCEPIVFACNLLAMAMDARSKITIAPAESARLALAVMDRIYGPPDVKARKKGADENQFELNFSWATPQGNLTVTAEGEMS